VIDSVGAPATRAPGNAPPPLAGERPVPHRRFGVPFLPAIFLATALLALGFGVGTWWSERTARPGPVDVGFYDDMSTHHLQAIRMANLYEQHGDHDDLRARAEEIAYFQAGDVRVMQDAMTEWGERGTPERAMEWMGTPVRQDAQPGMATPQELADLETARGRELDDLFTRLMIDHHAGGIHMAQEALDRARLDEVQELARTMATTQDREIDELNLLRQALGLPLHQPRG
jgi:uncharacterized protein (DUF305 family)